MPTPPTRTRTRRTAGSKTLGSYIDRHGLRPVTVYIPEEWHRAIASIAIETETTLQTLVTLACNAYFGTDVVDVPPLIMPTRTKQDPHKSFTWYADVDLHKKIKLLIVDIGGTAQQLILSAVVDYLRNAPRVKALKIETGFSAYTRKPDRPVMRKAT